jgi:hypothetical protein
LRREVRVEIGVKDEPVERGRAVTDGGIREAIETLARRRARTVGLAVGDGVMSGDGEGDGDGWGVGVTATAWSVKLAQGFGRTLAHRW